MTLYWICWLHRRVHLHWKFPRVCKFKKLEKTFFWILRYQKKISNIVMPHSQIKLKSLAKCFISKEIFGPLFHSCQREAFLIIAMSNLLHASLHCHPLHMRNRVENRILNSVFLKIFCCTLRTPSTHTLFFLVYRMDFCAVHRTYRLSKTRVLKKTKAVC